MQLTAHTASSDAVPGLRGQPRPHPGRPGPRPAPATGQLGLLQGRVRVEQANALSGRASFPRRNCFVTHACGRVAFSCRAVFSVSARGQFSYCVRPRSVQLLYPPAVSPADTLYPPHVDTCSACPSHVSIRCIPYEHGVSERPGPLAGPRCGRSSGRLFVPSRASGWARRGVAGSAAASSVR